MNLREREVLQGLLQTIEAWQENGNLVDVAVDLAANVNDARALLTLPEPPQEPAPTQPDGSAEICPHCYHPIACVCPFQNKLPVVPSGSGEAIIKLKNIIDTTHKLFMLGTIANEVITKPLESLMPLLESVAAKARGDQNTASKLALKALNLALAHLRSPMSIDEFVYEEKLVAAIRALQP